MILTHLFVSILRPRLANEARFIATETPLSVKHRLAISQLSIVVRLGWWWCSRVGNDVLDKVSI